MTDWKISKLDAICNNITDGEHGSIMDDPKGNYYLLSNKNIINGKIYYNSNDRIISETDFKKINRRTKLAVGDIVFSTVGVLGKSAIVKGSINYDFQRSVGIIKPNTGLVNTNYLYYYLNTKFVRKRVNDLSKGAVQKCFFISDLRNLDIHLPKNLLIQEKIGDVLSALDNKIELNNQINAELEAMAKTLYDYWFVQFDFPFDFAQGKPDASGQPYKSSGGKMVYNEVLKREIPEGWEVKNIGNVLETYLGGTPSTSNAAFWNGNIPWLNSGEVANFPLMSTEQSITKEAINNSSTRLLKKGSVLLSITRHLRVNILGIDACINQSVVAIAENEKFRNTYIYFSVLNDISRLMKLRTGAQQPHINKAIVDKSLFIIPKTTVLENYYKIAKPLFAKIITNAKQNQEFAQLRDWLLPMLMNGQVTVGDVEELGMVAEEKVSYQKS